MEGLWGAVADDLDGILTTLKDRIEEAPVIVKDLGVQQAIEAWQKLARIANQYRANAYITVQSEAAVVNADPARFDVRHLKIVA
jgi:hypothetical protein